MEKSNAETFSRKSHMFWKNLGFELRPQKFPSRSDCVVFQHRVS